MRTNEENTKKQKFIESIVDAIQMNITDFTNNLKTGKPYEQMIYQWITTLYEDEIPVEEAVSIIHQKRLQVLFNNSEVKSPDLEIAKIRNRVMSGIKHHPAYKELNNNNIQKIHSKIDALVKPNLHSSHDIVAIVSNIMNQLLQAQQQEIKNNLKPKNHKRRNKMFVTFPLHIEVPPIIGVYNNTNTI